MPIDVDRLVLPVDIRAETPGVFHELRVLEQDTSFGQELTLLVSLLSANGLPGDAVTTKLRSRNGQATDPIKDGQGAILVHKSLLDVVWSRWVRVLWEVDRTVGVGGCCQDARENSWQTKVTLEQAPGFQDRQKDASETRRELSLVPTRGLDDIQLDLD